MSSMIDQVFDVFFQRCQTVALATGGVFEDRQAAFSKEEAPAINVLLKEASAQTLGDAHPARSILRVEMVIELAIYTRSALDGNGVAPSSRQLSSPIWQAAHAALMADPSLGGLASRLRWRRSAWQGSEADGAAGWALHTYEVTTAVRESDLGSPISS